MYDCIYFPQPQKGSCCRAVEHCTRFSYPLIGAHYKAAKQQTRRLGRNNFCMKVGLQLLESRTFASLMVRMRSTRSINCPKSAWFLYASRIRLCCSAASLFAWKIDFPLFVEQACMGSTSGSCVASWSFCIRAASRLRASLCLACNQ